MPDFTNPNIFYSVGADIAVLSETSPPKGVLTFEYVIGKLDTRTGLQMVGHRDFSETFDFKATANFYTVGQVAAMLGMCGDEGAYGWQYVIHACEVGVAIPRDKWAYGTWEAGVNKSMTIGITVGVADKFAADYWKNRK